MSTRSTIALLGKDGTVLVSYCHFDGYLKHNGCILHQHYWDLAKVERLIGFGDISCLREEIDLPDWKDSESVNGVSIFYGRDKKERNTGPICYTNFDEYMSSSSFQEYNYLYDATKWRWFLINIYTRTLEDLEEVLCDSGIIFLSAHEKLYNFEKIRLNTPSK